MTPASRFSDYPMTYCGATDIIEEADLVPLLQSLVAEFGVCRETLDQCAYEDMSMLWQCVLRL